MASDVDSRPRPKPRLQRSDNVSDFHGNNGWNNLSPRPDSIVSNDDNCAWNFMPGSGRPNSLNSAEVALESVQRKIMQKLSQMEHSTKCKKPYTSDTSVSTDGPPNPGCRNKPNNTKSKTQSCSSEDNNLYRENIQIGDKNVMLLCQPKDSKQKQCSSQIGDKNILINLQINFNGFQMLNQDGSIVQIDSDGEVWLDIRRRTKNQSSKDDDSAQSESSSSSEEDSPTFNLSSIVTSMGPNVGPRRSPMEHWDSTEVCHYGLARIVENGDRMSLKFSSRPDSFKGLYDGTDLRETSLMDDILSNKRIQRFLQGGQRECDFTICEWEYEKEEPYANMDSTESMSVPEPGFPDYLMVMSKRTYEESQSSASGSSGRDIMSDVHSASTIPPPIPTRSIPESNCQIVRDLDYNKDEYPCKNPSRGNVPPGSRSAEYPFRPPVPVPRKQREPVERSLADDRNIRNIPQYTPPGSGFQSSAGKPNMSPGSISSRSRALLPTGKAREDYSMGRAPSLNQVDEDMYNTISQPPAYDRPIPPRIQDPMFSNFPVGPTKGTIGAPELPPRRYLQLESAENAFYSQPHRQDNSSHHPLTSPSLPQGMQQRDSPASTTPSTPEAPRKKGLPPPPKPISPRRPDHLSHEVYEGCCARHSRHQLSPVTSQTSTESVEGSSWYHSHIDKHVSATRLTRNAQEGAFLVRKSSTGAQHPYSLDVFFQGKVDRLRIFKTEDRGAYYLEGSVRKTFSTLCQLIDKLMSQGLEIKDKGNAWHTIHIFPLDSYNYHSNVKEDNG